MEHNLVDTHAHLQMDGYDGDRNEVLERAGSRGTAIVNMGLDLSSSEGSVELGNREEGVFAGVGFHPHEAQNFESSSPEKLRELARSAPVVAIGEIGLDYYRDNSPREEQRNAFRAQLDLAVELDLPVSVHNRSSTRDLLDIFRDRKAVPRGVMHSFFGDLELAEKFLDLGLYLGLSGPLTFDGEEELRATAKQLPLDRLLLETDSPFLTPKPHRGKRNEPGYVSYVAEELARIREISAREVAEVTTGNARRLFGIDVS